MKMARRQCILKERVTQLSEAKSQKPSSNVCLKTPLQLFHPETRETGLYHAKSFPASLEWCMPFFSYHSLPTLSLWQGSSKYVDKWKASSSADICVCGEHQSAPAPFWYTIQIWWSKIITYDYKLVDTDFPPIIRNRCQKSVFWPPKLPSAYVRVSM